MSTAPTRRESLFASPRAQEQAHQLAGALDEGAAPEGEHIEILGTKPGGEILSLLHQIISIIGEGGTVTVGALPEVLTTTVAADLLGVSRTTLMKHVRSGELPSQQVGSHTKLRREDVLTFRRTRLEKQRQAIDELLALESEFDLQ